MTIQAIIARHAITKSSHPTAGDGMCAMELVDFLDRKRRGERVTNDTPLTDSPACVAPTIAAFVRSWNDTLPNDATRKHLLGPLLPLMLDTATARTDEQTRAWLATDWIVRVHTPAFLDLAGLGTYAAQLRALKPFACFTVAIEQQGALNVTKAAAGDAARAAAWSAAKAAALDVAGAAASDVAWDAAKAAASAAAWATALDAARAAALDAAGDAARAAAGTAARAEAGDAAGDAAKAAAKAAAWTAARAVLAPTVEMLQASACDLVRAMCAVGRS